MPSSVICVISRSSSRHRNVWYGDQLAARVEREHPGRIDTHVVPARVGGQLRVRLTARRGNTPRLPRSPRRMRST